ncbi:MFS transporter [Streptomyces longispororuber]|uniref:MFS transporter n=1 Tax=Streptomyces longispororuber TaxID=68230 RepID=UPI00210AA7F0|nr:MFS transporter [Streptomyces longispororuber]MCQ4206458.1 MHS family MFS transporter [Streptomyces longispororuber]
MSGTRTTPRRAALAALTGTSIEWYDFFIYATAAALVFRDVFFPPDMDPLLGTIVAFGTTSFGYLGRPVGAALFGHLGDRVGRKRTLIITLTTMGLATFGIGLLPTYQTAGALAPLLLITLRFAQGVAVGGEWGGAALLSVEHAPPGRRCFYGSFTQLGSSVGALCSSLVFTAAEHLGGDLTDGAWRLPFLLAILMVAVGLAVRLSVDESPEFTAVRAEDTSRAPLREVLSKMPGTVLTGAGAMLVATGGYYVTSSFFISYGHGQGGMPVSTLLNSLTVAALCEILFMPLAGWLGDRWQPQYVVIIGLLGIAIMAVPLFLASHSGSALLVYAASAVIAFCTACNYGPMAYVLSQLFPARVRYTGTSLSYQLSALTAGALTPIILPSLLAAAGGNPALVLGYLALLCLAACACVMATRRHMDTPAAPSPQPAGSP